MIISPTSSLLRFAAAGLIGIAAFWHKPVRAAETDLPTPPGSGIFGSDVKVLPNGNIAVADPLGVVSQIGAVYLYAPDGTLISTLTGSSSDDDVGLDGVTVLPSGNFIVASSNWHNNGVAVGAVTWVNGSSGLSGVVSASNSIIGTVEGDNVGKNAVTVLANGNYVIRTPDWNNLAGAVTWVNGGTGLPAGPISSSTSMLGANIDVLGGSGITALTNGNYVVGSSSWNGSRGAATWMSGTAPAGGGVSVGNSLIGSFSQDGVGATVTALSNGNYVVGSPNWNNGVANKHYGAVTWGNGNGGSTGLVSSGNSLVGTTAGDQIGFQVLALIGNGNYVVASSQWNNGIAGNHVGAATWLSGAAPTATSVSSSNSLFGTTAGDQVGYSGFNNGLIALSNGNYVVSSITWNNGGTGQHVGAATWGNGNSGTTGPVSMANSLYGTTASDSVSDSGVVALAGGGFVVGSQHWQNGVTNSHFGAATWGGGGAALIGAVSASNSLVGTTSNDQVGNGVVALSGGNYVVKSSAWNNGVPGKMVGAITWSNGASGSPTGPVSVLNSLYGTTAQDQVGAGALALNGGNYLVTSFHWNNGIANGAYGAATWGNGATGLIGPVSIANSLIGNAPNAQLGAHGASALGNGHYVVDSDLASLSFGDNRFALRGVASSANSVFPGGTTVRRTVAYDAARDRYVIGRPELNKVTLFTADVLFLGQFD